MPKFKVVLSRIVSVRAKDASEAQDKVDEMYRSEKIVLDADDFQDRTINTVIEVGKNIKDACPGCGENKFSVIEKLYHNADFDEGKLIISSNTFDNETWKVLCDNCGAEIKVPEEQLEYVS